jgi:hypothetical protein
MGMAPLEISDGDTEGGKAVVRLANEILGF